MGDEAETEKEGEIGGGSKEKIKEENRNKRKGRSGKSRRRGEREKDTHIPRLTFSVKIFGTQLLRIIQWYTDISLFIIRCTST